MKNQPAMQFALVQKAYPLGKPEETISICFKKCSSGAQAVDALRIARNAYRADGSYEELLTSASNPLRCRARYISEDGYVYRLFITAPEGAEVIFRRPEERDTSLTMAQIARRKAKFERLAKSKTGLLA